MIKMSAYDAKKCVRTPCILLYANENNGGQCTGTRIKSAWTFGTIITVIIISCDTKCSRFI